MLTEREAYDLESYVAQRVDPLPEGVITHLHKCRWWVNRHEAGCSSLTEFATLGGEVTSERWRKGRRAFKVVIEHGHNLVCRSACAAIYEWLDSHSWVRVKTKTKPWPSRKRSFYYTIEYRYNEPPKWVDRKMYARYVHEITPLVRAATEDYKFWLATDVASWMYWLAHLRASGKKPRVQKVLSQLIRDHLPDREQHEPVYQMVDELVRVWGIAID